MLCALTYMTKILGYYIGKGKLNFFMLHVIQTIFQFTERILYSVLFQTSMMSKFELLNLKRNPFKSSWL